VKALLLSESGKSKMETEMIGKWIWLSEGRAKYLLELVQGGVILRYCCGAVNLQIVVLKFRVSLPGRKFVYSLVRIVGDECVGW